MKAVLLLATMLVAASATEEIVAVRLERCSGCRMGRFPHCKKFIAEEAPKYPALEVKHVMGSSPIFYWLDKVGNTVKKTAIKETDTVEDHHRILAEHGITMDTPKPAFDPRDFPPSENCLAFRRHMVNKERLPLEDEPCTFAVPPGGGIGYCECKNGKHIEIDVQPTRVRFTCEEVCGAGRVPWTVTDDEEL
eukprot:TRINITY_DN2837_c0_g3_i2.p1 TRINITY_DN2837_c0_g3~~TRINITY_DN2837_c0_g3_i2.p1  ORF type:complete len:192 (+),score=37.61 TRINITY_DN2837_c0_g3_i2:133-708(+)